MGYMEMDKETWDKIKFDDNGCMEMDKETWDIINFYNNIK